MTIRTEQVDVTETVQKEIPICDGCGREVDLEHEDSTEWVPGHSGKDTVHTCHRCSIRTLTRGTGRMAPLRARLRTLSLAPEHPPFVAVSLMMSAITGGIIVSDVTAHPEARDILLVISAVMAGIGLLACVEEVEGGTESLVIIPLGGLVGLFGTSSGPAAWACLIAAAWLALAYVAYTCPASD